MLILAAGGSKAFEEAGYPYPKNLVEIHGKPLLQHVLENCAIPCAKMIVVLRRDEVLKYHTDKVVRLLYPEAQIILSPQLTSGAACAALLSIELINNDSPLLIVNGDQILLQDHLSLVENFTQRGLDGGIPVFEDVHPRYSFVRLNKEGLVIEAAEKRPISRHATAGRYYFSRGNLFVRATQEMILKDSHVDGAFYVCPSYNQAILAGAKIGVASVERSAYFSLSSPQGIKDFLASENHRTSL